MIDFDFKFRWFRILYVGVLSAFIFFIAGWIPALICMLAIIDINFDEKLFEKGADDLDLEELDLDDRGFGPDS